MNTALGRSENLEKVFDTDKSCQRTSEAVTGGPVALLCPQHRDPVQVSRLTLGLCAPVQSSPAWERIQVFELSSDRLITFLNQSLYFNHLNRAVFN